MSNAVFVEKMQGGDLGNYEPTELVDDNLNGD